MIFDISSWSCCDRRRQCIILSVWWVYAALINSIAPRSHREFQSALLALSRYVIKSMDRENYGFPLFQSFWFLVSLEAFSVRRVEHDSEVHRIAFFEIYLKYFLCKTFPLVSTVREIWNRMGIDLFFLFFQFYSWRFSFNKILRSRLCNSELMRWHSRSP